MKKLICWLLAITLVAACALPAGAVDSEEATASPSPITVTTADELLGAIEAAEDGDTIRVGATIGITESVTFGQEGKQIFLERDNGFSEIMFSGAAAEVVFESLNIEGGGSAASIIAFGGEIFDANQLKLRNVQICNCGDSAVKLTSGNLVVENCQFEGGRAGLGTHLLVTSSGRTQITNSTFKDGYADSIGGSIRSAVGGLYIDGCSFIANGAGNSGGAIYASGDNCSISNSVITQNSAGGNQPAAFGSGCGGGIYISNASELINVAIFDNHATGSGSDIFTNARIDISLSESDLETVYQSSARTPIGFYTDNYEDRFDGETNITAALSMPVKSELGGLIFICDGDITAQIAEPEPPDQQESEEPTQPSEPETPQETEPPETEPSEEPAHDSEPELPSGTDTQSPVVPPRYWPSENPTHASSSKGSSEPSRIPAAQQKTKAAANSLSCGGATLNTSDRAFLSGYGDGVIGESDPVTRAQIAQIIYRLMTEESRAALQTTENGFPDVPADAWYNLAVSTIARAGIVVGTGDGFHPEDNVTRAQLITIMARFIAPSEFTSSYTDVAGHWAENFIAAAEGAGWLSGGGNLRPNEYATRHEVVEFINHIFDLCEGAA